MVDTKTSKATEYKTFPTKAVEEARLAREMPAEEVIAKYGIRPMQDVVTDLLDPYNGLLSWLADGNAYISWNTSAERANRIFGFFGWSDQLKSVEPATRVYTRKDANENTYEVEEHGWLAIVHITVRALMPDGSILEKHLENDGFAVANANPKGTDTATKAAASDAFSRTMKKLGDAFGLYLYEKFPDEEEQVYRRATAPAYTNNSRPAVAATQAPRQQAPTETPARPAYTGKPAGSGDASPAQRGMLRGLGYPKDIFDGEGLSKAQASNYIKLIKDQGMTVEQVTGQQAPAVEEGW